MVCGQRSINSNVAIDGADFNDSLQGNQRGGNEAVFFFPQTAIREFQVVRSGASAEVGRTNAGFVNAVTKSGTNQFHGEGFYFNRNHALTSPDAFGNKLNNKQNQFGGSIGGPLSRDRAFFFVGVEQNFLRIPYLVRFLPPPSGTAVPANLASLQGEQATTNNPGAFCRVDWNLSKRTRNLQYTYARLHGSNFNLTTTRPLSALLLRISMNGPLPVMALRRRWFRSPTQTLSTKLVSRQRLTIVSSLQIPIRLKLRSRILVRSEAIPRDHDSSRRPAFSLRIILRGIQAITTGGSALTRT